MGTKIEWSDETWNPTTGCSRVSPGCDNCYAMRMAGRLLDGRNVGYEGTTHETEDGADWTGVVHLHDDRLDDPLSWEKPRRIFVDSMSDLFHPTVPFSFIDRVYATMLLTQRHIYQILTKRPGRMVEYLEPGSSALKERWSKAARDLFSEDLPDFEYPPSNVWLGTSVEDEEASDRIDTLRSVEASIRFLSLEPLLEPLPDLNLEGIDWVIVGGESGLNARPMKRKWVVQIRDQCQDAGVPFFFKQWGDHQKEKEERKLEGREWNEMPQDCSHDFDLK